MEIRFFLHFAFNAFFAPLVQVVNGLDPLGNSKLQRFERFAAGIEAQAAVGGIQSFRELVQSQTSGRSAVPGLDVSRVEFQNRRTVLVA